MSRIDILETINGATVHHGPFNKRLYLMKLGSAQEETLYRTIMDLAKAQGYEKICLKIPRSKTPFFLDKDFHEEASIPGFYNGIEDGVFLGLFLCKNRESLGNPTELDDVLALAEEKRNESQPKGRASDNQGIELLQHCHTDEMADIYRQVFPSYPFPIDRPDYLAENMDSHVYYFGICNQGRLVALSSAECDCQGQNVEMTDFATIHEFRGQGHAQRLLAYMEAHMRDLGFKTAYTIARAISPGMNITFARLGYIYGGRLLNNTHISGRIESMNIWYKTLAI